MMLKRILRIPDYAINTQGQFILGDQVQVQSSQVPAALHTSDRPPLCLSLLLPSSMLLPHSSMPPSLVVYFLFSLVTCLLCMSHLLSRPTYSRSATSPSIASA